MFRSKNIALYSIVFLITILSGRERLLAQQAASDSIRSLLNLATECRNKGDYEKTIELLRKSHQMRKALYSDSTSEMVNSYYNMGRIHHLIWDYDSALHYLQMAERSYELCLDCDELLIGDIYSYMGRTFIDKGENLEASIMLKKAQKHFMSLSPTPNSKLAHLISRIADNENLLRNYDIALEYYQDALKYISSAAENNYLLMLNYDRQARTYSQMGEIKNSIAYQKRALVLARKDSASEPIALAILYNNLGVDYTELNQLDKAIAYFNRALHIYKEYDIDLFASKANLFESIGSLYLKAKEYDSALFYYQNALKIVAPDFQNPDVFSNPELSMIEYHEIAFYTLKSKSACFLELYNKEKKDEYMEAALETIHGCIDIIESQRNSRTTLESKMLVADMQYDIFDNCLNLYALVNTGNDDVELLQKAFSVSERSKSSTLLATLQELDARELGGIPDSLLKKEKDLTTRLGFYRSNIYEEKQLSAPDSLKISVWEDKYFKAYREHNRLIRLFEEQYPKYYELKYDPRVSDIKQLQQHLGKDYSLVQFNLTDTSLHTFFISKQEARFFSQRLPADFDSVARAYLDNFHHFDFSRQTLEDFRQYCRNSFYLYKLLIEPIEDGLKTTKLIVVPDGILSYLPFESLIRKLPGEDTYASYKNLDYLIWDYNISYAYSSTLYVKALQQKQNKKVSKLLAFAPSYGISPDEFPQLAARRAGQNYNENLSPIPGALDEVKALEQLMHADVYEKLGATEKAFREHVANYDIVHLAMHAIIDNRNPLFSKLIFAPETDSVHDGLLNTFEVFGLDLNARMVVLSACSTGEGEYSKGEGVLSLARGFAYAGTPSLVMTMWKVEDNSGLVLMKEFYRQLQKGKSKAEALRLAKIKYLEETPPERAHPFFWSSFAVLGNPEPLYTEEPKSNRLLIWGGIGLGLLLILLAVILIRRRRKITS